MINKELKKKLDNIIDNDSKNIIFLLLNEKVQGTDDIMLRSLLKNELRKIIEYGDENKWN